MNGKKIIKTKCNLTLVLVTGQLLFESLITITIAINDIFIAAANDRSGEFLI